MSVLKKLEGLGLVKKAETLKEFAGNIKIAAQQLFSNNPANVAHSDAEVNWDDTASLAELNEIAMLEIPDTAKDNQLNTLNPKGAVLSEGGHDFFNILQAALNKVDSTATNLNSAKVGETILVTDYGVLEDESARLKKTHS